MANEALRGQVNELLQSVHDYAQEVERAREQRDRLLVTADTAGNRVSVTVDAEGFVVDVRFADDANELTLDEIAAAVRTAARDAAVTAKQEAAEIMRAVPMPPGMLGFSEILPGLPDFDALRTMLSPDHRRG
jgi:DNA-binding protein YbaB